MSRRERWDLVVVGAGPAGAAAALGALRASPGLRVLLLDRADFPRDKSCGDGVAPLVVDALAEVGAGDVVDGWAPLHTLEIARGGRSTTGALPRPVWVVPRAVLDARVVEHAVRAGAVLRQQRVGEVRREPGSVLVDDDLEADVVVGADGAHSVVRRTLGRARHERSALAIRGYAPTPPGRAERQVIRYGDRRQPAYAWSFDRGDGLSNVGYGELLAAGGGPPTRAALLARLDHLLPGATDGGHDWRGHHLPLSSWSWRHPDGPVLLAGDAAGLVNPMTGEGIYYAVATGLRAGRAAARAIADPASGGPARVGARYRRAVRRLLARHLRHTATAARLSDRPAFVDAGLAASARDPRVFDDLVEIGLGRGLITRRLGTGLVTALLAGRPDEMVTR